MVRTQVQLDEGKLARLRRMAAEEGVSVAELLRQGADLLLTQRRKPSREELWERASKCIGAFSSGLPDVAERHDDYFVEAIEHGHSH